MKKTITTILGLLLAPVAPAIFFALSSPGLGGGVSAEITTLFYLSLLGYFFAGIFTLIFGLPLFIILNRKKLVFWWSAILSGFTVGILACLCFSGPAYIFSSNSYVGLGLWGASGALAGVLFWLVWRLGNQSLTHQSSGTGESVLR